MSNDQLRNAVKRAGLTLEEFADILGVDAKTVQRWVGGRTPYPRHRAKVAAALDTPEHELWPDTVPPPAEPTVTVTADQPLGLNDTIAGYPSDDHADAPQPVRLIAAAREELDIVIPSLSSLTRDPTITESLIARAHDGCRVRIIIDDPDPQLRSLFGHDGIDLHASPGGEDYGLTRADDEMLLTLRRLSPLTEPAPVIHLQRRTTSGLFDRLTDQFDQSWADTTPLHTTRELDDYLADTTLEDEEFEPDRSPMPQSVGSSNGAAPAEDPDPPRRWPGRRD